MILIKVYPIWDQIPRRLRKQSYIHLIVSCIRSSLRSGLRATHTHIYRATLLLYTHEQTNPHENAPIHTHQPTRRAGRPRGATSKRGRAARRFTKRAPPAEEESDSKPTEPQRSLRLEVGSNLIVLERTTPTSKAIGRATVETAPHTVETAKDQDRLVCRQGSPSHFARSPFICAVRGPGCGG